MYAKSNDIVMVVQMITSMGITKLLPIVVKPPTAALCTRQEVFMTIIQ